MLLRRIVGRRASRSLRNDLALDALEQAPYDRPIGESERLITWVAWRKGSHLLEPLGHAPPAMLEEAIHA